MAKKKTYTFRVEYEALAHCRGTVILEKDDDELSFNRGKVKLEELCDDIEGEVEGWAEGYQAITTPDNSYLGGDVKPDYDSQSDEWQYWPEQVEIKNIEDITAEADLVGTAEICPTKMQAFVPVPKGRVKNPVFYECNVPRQGRRKVFIEAEPGQSIRVEVDTRYRQDMEAVLKWLHSGDMDARTKKEAKEIQQLFKS